MNNPFSVGQRVKCVSDDFLFIKEESLFNRVTPILAPKLNQELLIIDTIGSYLMFECSASSEGTYWFHHRSFAPLESLFWRFEEFKDDYVIQPSPFNVMINISAGNKGNIL